MAVFGGFMENFMENYGVIITVVQLVIAGAVAIIGFFLKRQVSRQDSFATKEDVSRLEKDVDENKKDIKGLNDKFATKQEIKEIKDDISEMRKSVETMRENTVSKEEFVRNMTELKEDLKDLKALLMNK